MYNFLFDKKTLMLLLAGLGLSGALLFFAGLLVGVEVGLPPASGAVAVRPPPVERPEPPAAKKPEPAPAAALAECPCELGVQTAALPAEPCPEPEPPAAPPVEKAAPAPVPVKEPEPVAVASVPVPEPEPELEPETGMETGVELAAALEPGAEVVVAEAAPAEAQAQPAEVTPLAFSVQVGAFRSPENMERVLEDLRSRGYEPYVVELTGSRKRVLHAVRIGRYTDRSEALQAASDFRRRERMAALVLRTGS